ncbi:MAG: DUF2330 domain-containing protein [Myxococcota bacterium]
MIWLIAGQVASACGGTVCDGGTSSTPTSPGTTSTGGGPIVQSGETVVFVQQDDDWNALVQIETQGPSSAFGWVIPVPNRVDANDVTIAPEGLIDELEQATAPQFQTDAGLSSSESSGTSCASCGGVPSVGELVQQGANQLLEAVELNGVAVVGPYEVASVGPEQMDELEAWFQAGGYFLPDSTWPIIDDYVAKDYSFVILRLLPLQGQGQGTVDTVVIPCGQAAPAIPLRLTSIAAVSDMSITTYVVSNMRYAPGNWDEVAFDPSAVDPSDPSTDYSAQLQTAIDDSGGKAFRTEFAGRVDSLGLSRDTLDALGPSPYITRFRSWASPEDMSTDPEFVTSDVLDDVSNVIDLRTNASRSAVGLFAPLLLGLVGVARRRRG